MREQEQESWRAAWASLAPSEPGPLCAPPDEIWGAVHGRLSQPRLRVLLEHSASCADCASLWRLARELSPAEEPLRFPRKLALAGAGALLAAALVVLVVLPRSAFRREQPMMRGAQPGGLRPVAPDEPLLRARPRLRWTGGAEGSRYAVTVSTPDLKTLYRADALSIPELDLPPGTLDPVPPGGSVVWRVEAVAPDGRRSSSATFLIQVH
jgi:hypothetical protein